MENKNLEGKMTLEEITKILDQKIRFYSDPYIDCPFSLGGTRKFYEESCKWLKQTGEYSTPEKLPIWEFISMLRKGKIPKEHIDNFLSLKSYCTSNYDYDGYVLPRVLRAIETGYSKQPEMEKKIDDAISRAKKARESLLKAEITSFYGALDEQSGEKDSLDRYKSMCEELGEVPERVEEEWL